MKKKTIWLAASCLIVATLILASCGAPAFTPAITPAITEEEEGKASAELSNVQSAMTAMMVDNSLSTLPNPVTVATNDMTAFPDTSVCGVDKIQDPNGDAYVRGKDKDGYLLYQHDIEADGGHSYMPIVNYVAEQFTKGTYTVDAQGTVTQVTTGY